MAQDSSQIIINLADSLVVSYANALVKQKALILEYQPIINSAKDFRIKLRVSYYVNNAGAYGGRVLDVIQTNQTWSDDQKRLASASYQDWIFEYQSTGKYVDVNGDVVPQDTIGAIPEMEYWQSFKLNQVTGIAGTTALQGAIDAEYKIIAAIIAKLNTRKS